VKWTASLDAAMGDPSPMDRDEMGIDMQLFTRQLMTAGPEGEAAAWATEMAAAASAKMGTEVALWAAGFGAPIGAIAFTMRVEGIADLMAKAAPLAGDADYQAKLAKGADVVVGPPQDSLATPLHGDLGDPPPVGAMAVVTNAVIANGQYAEAIGWGIDVAQHVTSLTGMPVGLMMQEYGAFGQLTWIGIGADAAAIDASAAASNSDADYIKKLSAAGDLFVPGSGHRSLVTRVA
jgi:hypothetical protein